MSDHQGKAADLFRKAAEAGDPEGQFQYALCLRDGRGVSKDSAEAHKWLQKAATAGHLEATNALSEVQKSQATPSQTTPTNPQGPTTQEEKWGCASVAIIAVGLLFAFFAHFCTTTGEINWPVALTCTATITVGFAAAFYFGNKRVHDSGTTLPSVESRVSKPIEAKPAENQQTNPKKEGGGCCGVIVVIVIVLGAIWIYNGCY
jgi:hypothetical protein